MALRKRSYKPGGKIAPTFFHNMRVDAQNARKARLADEKRRKAVAARLKGEGIHESWLDDALKIMDEQGLSLNQVGTRVVPELKRAIREQRERARQKEEQTRAAAEQKLQQQQRKAELAAERERERTEKRRVASEQRQALELAKQRAREEHSVQVSQAIEGANRVLQEIHDEMRKSLLYLKGEYRENNELYNIYFFPYKLSIFLRLLKAVFEGVLIAITMFIGLVIAIVIYEPAALIVLVISIVIIPAYIILRIISLRKNRLKLSYEAVQGRINTLADSNLLGLCRQNSQIKACSDIVRYSRNSIPSDIIKTMKSVESNIL